MTRRRSVPGRRLLHPRWQQQRERRITAVRAVRESLLSVAGLLGTPVVNQAGEEIGTLVDLVDRWADEPYPPITGLVVRVARRHVFVPAEQVVELTRRGARLRSARLDLREVERRPGEVLLARDVLDHQLVDTDGIKVIRAADLYIARVGDGYRLVGVDVGLQTLLRRLGPARFRWLPTPDRVIDWAAIQPFGIDPGGVRLRASTRRLHRLRPSELADLLEDLERPARQALLAELDPDTAADALEEMDPEELDALLHEVSDDQAATLLGRMEPDEAVDALREMEPGERDELLGRLPEAVAQRLRRLLAFPEDRAGGFMTSDLVVVDEQATVAEVTGRLREVAADQSDTDLVVAVDDAGRLVDVIGVLELLLAAPERRVGELVGPPWPVTVGPGATVEEVADALVDNRRNSVLVVDDAGRPLGRIQADDVVDALLPGRGRLHFPRLLQ
ncbi:MAG TPA: CBS domain-containing protein [Actinomycetota bacterium]|jgi:CBS domain-containing protein